MNNVIEAILKRRSVRAYQEKQITDEELDLIIKSGQYAPTAMGQQSFKLVAVQNKDLLGKIDKGCQKVRNMNSSPFYGAPTLIIAFAKTDSIAPTCDASTALENMMVAAASLGVSSCWIHAVTALFKTEEGKAIMKEMGVEEEYSAYGSCVLGYNAGKEVVAAPRQDTVIIIK